MLPNVLWESSPRGQAHHHRWKSRLDPASSWSGPCCVLSPHAASVSSEEFTISLGSPSNSLSITAFLQMWSLVFCSCVWPDCPIGSFSQAPPIMPQCSDLNWGKKMENVVSVKILLLVKSPVSLSLVGYKRQVSNRMTSSSTF